MVIYYDIAAADEDAAEAQRVCEAAADELRGNTMHATQQQ